MRKLFATALCSACILFAHAQTADLSDSIYTLFNRQLQAFPMEKIYVRTDKPYYLAGEDVFYRIYLVDALSLIPDTISRYVYAELINPWNELVRRVKIRPVNGAYHGYFSLPEEMAEGSYEMRFYTRFMENNGEDFYFRRKINVGDPLSALYVTKSDFTVSDNKKRIDAVFEVFDTNAKERILPEKARIRDPKDGKLKEVEVNKDSTISASFNTNELKNNVIYLEYDYNGKFHKAFLPVISENEDYDVSFFPEGGQLPVGVRGKVAFKALSASGFGVDVEGSIVSDKGDTIDAFQSVHKGMGVFSLLPEQGLKYFAVCKNSAGLEKRFPLTNIAEKSLTINVLSVKDRINVTLLHSPDYKIPDSLYIIVHCGGVVLMANKWDNSREFMVFNKSELPTGVSQVLLTDAKLNPLCERLLFSIEGESLPASGFSTDQPTYGKRAAINASLQLTDSTNRPLNGDFSVSVTDDNVVTPDTAVNILSSMLLTSELRGHIEEPAFYFTEPLGSKARYLDVLMLTQGWRRYDVKRTLQGDIQKPKGFLELGSIITGSVKGGVLMTTTAKDYPVTLISDGFFDQTTTDNEGKFIFNLPDLADSTRITVQAMSKKGGTRVEIQIDTIRYPATKALIPTASTTDASLFTDYIEKADQQFVQEFGMHTIYLDEVVVTGKKTVTQGKSAFTSAFNTIIPVEEYQEKWHAHNIYDLLRNIPGVQVNMSAGGSSSSSQAGSSGSSGGFSGLGSMGGGGGGSSSSSGVSESTESTSLYTISIRGASGEPLVMIDDSPWDADILADLEIDDIDQIEVVKDAQAAIFGQQGANGAILISTKQGFDQARRKSKSSFNIKAMTPLGFQKPKEFYQPKYDTTYGKANKKADLRTTIYWNPDVKVKDGKASFSFFSADLDTHYSVIIEGITSEGKPFYSKQTITAGK
jgi:TonB-dependent SusC/RagA subfamily outer membrane receptor